MSLFDKIVNFFESDNHKLDSQKEIEIIDYLYESESGLKNLEISESEKEKIVEWKVKEFKKFINYDSGFQPNRINLELFRDWEKKNHRNFCNWCDENSLDYSWFLKFGIEWEKKKLEFESEIKKIKKKKGIN